MNRVLFALSQHSQLPAMATSQNNEVSRSESPDPSSYAATIYDASGNEGEWLDETDDDDMDFEPATDESEDIEFFDPEEDSDTGFHGMGFIKGLKLHLMLLGEYAIRYIY